MCCWSRFIGAVVDEDSNVAVVIDVDVAFVVDDDDVDVVFVIDVVFCC